MQPDVKKVPLAQRSKRSESNVQRDLGDCGPRIPALFEDPRRKMESRSRCRNRSSVLGKNGLIALAV